MNKGGQGAQRLFACNKGLIYPDFISKNSRNRIIADAKYKSQENIGNKDYLQVLAYMYRFDARKGFYLYPEQEESADQILQLNSGSTFEKDVMAREDICLIKHGLKIPKDVYNYDNFVEKMKRNEQQFQTCFKEQ